MRLARRPSRFLRWPRSLHERPAGVAAYAAALAVLAAGLSLTLPTADVPQPGDAPASLTYPGPKAIDTPVADWAGRRGGPLAEGARSTDVDGKADAAYVSGPTPIAPEPSPTPTHDAVAVAQAAPSRHEPPRPQDRGGPRPVEPTNTPSPSPSPAEPQPSQVRELATYAVSPGDTVSVLAERFNVSVGTIIRANALANPESLSPGQELVILPVSGTLHTVVEGDTVIDLAERYGLIPEEIIAVNRLEEPYLIFPGQKLVIPEVPAEARQQPTAPEPQPLAKPLQPLTHDVAAGDTASAIAARFGVSLASLLAANDLEATQPLRVGQTLTVPPPGTALHLVKEGDTVTAVAAKYGASALAIIQANALTEPYHLQIGRLVVVPGGTPPVRALATPTRTPPPATPTATPRPAPTSAASPAAGTSPRPKPESRPQSAEATATAPPPTAKAEPTATVTPLPPTPTPAPPPRERAVSGSQVVGIAMRYLGYRYVWGGTTPQPGFDCSGFVMYVLRQAGVPVPRDLWGQLNSGPRVARSALRPGDLVFFQNTYRAGLSHDGIYIGDGQFVHAASENTGVIVTRLDHPYWNARYYAASRPY